MQPSSPHHRPDPATDAPTDLSRFRSVPDVEALRGLRRPGRADTFREGWTPARTLSTVALAPLAFWLYADISSGLATSSAAWVVLTAAISLVASFVVTSYLPAGPRGSRQGVAGTPCAAGPVIGLFLSGWLLHNTPTLLGAVLALVMVVVAAVQRVTRTTC